jgi:hypothetical protein
VSVANTAELVAALAQRFNEPPENYSIREGERWDTVWHMGAWFLFVERATGNIHKSDGRRPAKRVVTNLANFEASKMLDIDRHGRWLYKGSERFPR